MYICICIYIYLHLYVCISHCVGYVVKSDIGLTNSPTADQELYQFLSETLSHFILRNKKLSSKE